MLKLKYLQRLVESLQKQLGIRGSVNVPEYSFVFGLKEGIYQTEGKISGIEINYLKKAFLELVNFDGKIIFFPNRVSFSISEKEIKATAKFLMDYLEQNWIPFKNEKKFYGSSLEEQKLNFLSDFLDTVIKRASDVLIDVIIIPYDEKEGFLADKFPITEKSKKEPFFFRGVSYSLRGSFLVSKAIIKEIKLFKRGELGQTVPKDIPWNNFWKSVEKGEFLVKDSLKFKKIVENWIEKGVKEKASDFKWPSGISKDKIKNIISRFL